MGCRILIGHEAGCDREIACLFCSTTQVVFGPIFDGEYDPSGDGDAHDEADSFLTWLEKHPSAIGRTDARVYSAPELSSRYDEFCKEVAAARKAVDQ